MGIETIIWLFLVAFMIHEFEEIIYLTTWTKKNLNKILERTPKSFHKMVKGSASRSQTLFSFAVFEEFIWLSLFLFLCVLFQWYALFITIVIGYLLHILVHVMQSIYLKMYIPAVGTGILSAIYSIYAIIYIASLIQINWPLVILLVPIAALIIIINLKLAFFLGKKLVKE